MPKTEVYSWRVAAETKMALESELRANGRSIAELLDELANEWLRKRSEERTQEDSEQMRLQAQVRKLAGSVSSSSRFTSEDVEEVVRKRIIGKLERNANQRAG
jgi:hypothetical protein